jgi:hypothetical protein
MGASVKARGGVERENDEFVGGLCGRSAKTIVGDAP